MKKEITWGDVMTAAMDACCAAGVDKPVRLKTLISDIKKIIAVRIEAGKY